MKGIGAAACGLILALQAASGAAADWYVSTAGTPAGDGSIGNPWSLRWALAHPPAVQPGDTIWVRGGTYPAATSRLKGSSTQPIIVRNYNRERVIIDGAGTNCSVGSTTCDGFVDPCTCDAATDSRCPNYRPDAFTVAACGHDTWFWGLEMTDSEPGRFIGPSGCTTQATCCWVNGDPGQGLRPECETSGTPLLHRTQVAAAWIYGDDIKFINCMFHDAGNGVAWWEPSQGKSEFYGSWIFNNGWMTPLRGNGHAFYTQNSETNESDSHKTIRDTIVWNNFGWGVHARGGCGRVQGYTVENCISFGNGVPKKVFYDLDPVFYADSLNSSYPAYFFESAAQMRDIAVRDSYSYGPIGANQYVTSLNAGAEGHFHSDIAVENNYLVGDGPPVYLQNWTMAKVTGNTFVGGLDNNAGNNSENLVINIDERTSQHLSEYVWDNNAFFMNGTSPTPFVLSYRFWGPTYRLTFNDWKTTTGLDTSSTYTVGLPTVNKIAVLPNAYEQGRAHIVIYNWENLTTVPVDLSTSGLTDGQTYKIYNIQTFKIAAVPDYFGNVVASGTYSSASPVVNVPMTDTGMTQPIDFGATVPPTMPQFGAFLLLGGV